MFDTELTLLEMRYSHPERFEPVETFRSDLHIVPKSQGLGIIGIMEIVFCLFLSKEIKNASGKPASFKQIAKAFEYIFNLNFGNIYDRRDEVYKRKAFNLTKALDFLKNVLEKNRNNKLLKKDEK